MSASRRPGHKGQEFGAGEGQGRFAHCGQAGTTRAQGTRTARAGPEAKALVSSRGAWEEEGAHWP